jgi:non-specific serine/threonine protein kinase
LILTPKGHLNFEGGSGHGLLRLGLEQAGAALEPDLAYWRDFAVRYVAALCVHGQGVAPPPDEELERVVSAAPPMTGAEYLTVEVLRNLWREIDAAFGVELAEAKCDVQEFLKRRHSAWNTVGRVHFNLAENRKDPDAPFAFLATYTTHLSSQAKAQHLPLGRALTEYAGAANRDRLLSLLLPVQRASETCPWLKEMVDAGEIYHPLRWTPQEALQVLRDVPQLESAGVIVRMPAAWRGNRPPTPARDGYGGRQAAVRHRP